MATVIIHSDVEPNKRKSVIASTISPSIRHEVMGPDTLDFFNIDF